MAPLKRDQTGPSLKFRSESGEIVDYVAPKTSADLKRYFEQFFGLTVADKAVCKGHCSPLDALAAAYFAERPVVIWEGSRGLAGKSSLLGGLAVAELLLGADVVVLGGSQRQSQKVHEVEKLIWDHKIDVNGREILGPFRNLLAEEPTQTLTRTLKNNWLKAIPASQKTARGEHPQRLRLDEVDEMDADILEAALGQPMAYNNISDQVVMSSTHQYANGTFTKMLERAKERKWPVYKWCMKESHVNNGGWLTDEMVTRARERVGERMWRVEYELQQPSIEGRILSEETIKRVFGDGRTKQIFDKLGRSYQFEAPVVGAKYCTGCDWAQSEDYTTITTIRYDCLPAKVVAYERTQKEDWPVMVAKAEQRTRDYPGLLVHDGLQQGSVIQGYLTVDAYPFEARGDRRYQLYADYIIALEKGLITIPKVESLKKEHEYVTHEDIYVTGGHPPDGLCSVALAWQGVIGKAKDPVKFRPAQFGRPLFF